MSEQDTDILPGPDGGEHEPVVTPWSFLRATDGAPLEPPLQASDFPALADCQICGKPLRKQTSLGNWTHDDDEQ